MNTALLLAPLLANLLATDGVPPTPESTDARWLRGNTHTHTLWSDGDAPPETAVAWYVDHGYQFLVLSDHNLVQAGERWFDVTEDGRLTPAKVEGVKNRFGEDWPETRTVDGEKSMRLRTLPELKARFDRPETFVLIPGEEVTSSHRLAQIHINAINVDESLPALRGESVQSTIQENLDAIEAWGREKDRPVIGHVNHPNFRKSLAASNLARIEGPAFFEVYNGHRSVENERIGTRPSTEEMWDLALVDRLHGASNAAMVFGLASDDAHDHYQSDAVSIPGRGWIMVRSRSFEPDEIVDAIRSGDFYASSGVGLHDISADTESIIIDIDAHPEITYETEFIGATPNEDGSTPTSRVLARTGTDPAVYRFSGDELYVRARVISSRPHPRPYRSGDRETAWTQPVRGPGTKPSGDAKNR
ncbi:MAG: hypothetical protein GY895_11060 [Phycisphaera sp.]|nr:hypothetical protein [Phycisphaera sp.]